VGWWWVEWWGGSDLSWLCVLEDDVEAGGDAVREIAGGRLVARTVGDLVVGQRVVEGGHDGPDGVTALIIEAEQEVEEGPIEDPSVEAGEDGLAQGGELGGDEG
jgi:hypothetical protein